MSSNLDPGEIRKFQSLANDWWDIQGPLHTLHEINPVRLEYLQQSVAGGVRGKRILDVGCGAGILSEAMARQGAEVLGIDLAEDAIAAGRHHAQEESVTLQYRVIAVEELAAAEPASYDVVTCMEMLEHVPDPASIVSACGKLVKPGGDVFLSTLNRNPKSYLYAIVGAEYILGLLPRGTHDYEKFLRPSELLEMVRSAGLRIQDVRGLHYDPWRHNACLTDDVSVNYLCHCRRPT